MEVESPQWAPTPDNWLEVSTACITSLSYCSCGNYNEGLGYISVSLMDIVCLYC